MANQFRKLTYGFCVLTLVLSLNLAKAQDLSTRPFILSQNDITNFMTTLFKPFVSGFNAIYTLINNVPTDLAFPAQTQHKEQALNDHSNDAIFSSTSQEIIERSGFKQKTYFVTTEDGYITELINVINPKADPSQLKQPPVMIFHGGLIDTNTWLWGSAIQHHPENYPRTAADGPITSSNRSLGMMLPNYGYNVWLVGTRGSNRMNLGHTTLKTKLLEDIIVNPLDPEAPREIIDTLKYYDYSQDELVDFGLPAQIEKVLNLTGSSKVNAITYSFSTQLMFKLLASNKEIAPKIYTHCALEPLLNRIGTSNLLKVGQDLLLLVPEPIGNLLQQLLFSQFTRDFARKLDRYTITYFIVNLAAGPNPKFQSFLEDPVIGHALQPTSFKEIKHYIQQLVTGKLQRYDYGPVKNVELYGQPTPPVYNLKDIDTPRWMLVTGDTDILGTINSADIYVSTIPHKPYKYIRRTNGWNHVDSSVAFDVDTIVNLPIVDFLDHFSSQFNGSTTSNATVL